MAWITQLRSSPRHRVVALAVCAAIVIQFSSMAPASAQNLGWFGGIFSGGTARPFQGAPAYPGYGYGGGVPDSYYYRQPRRHVLRRKSEHVQREASPKEKPAPTKDASIFVYVFGDSLGQLLANGLDDAFQDRQDVAVVHEARAWSGLAASKGYDWPKKIEDLVAGRDPVQEAADKDRKPEQKTDTKIDATAKDATAKKDAKSKIDAAVMMIGLNDRQSIEQQGKILKSGTPEWVKAYTDRVMEIDKAFRSRNIPLVWVGIPITKDDDLADEMAALNDIYRDCAAKTGAVFVDTWEAFSDDDGDFSFYGPDINGQTVRLRSADGIRFTKAGARKLAHFVETHVRRALEGKTPPAQLPTADAPQADTLAPGDKPVVVAKPDAGPIRNLNDAPAAAGGTLASYKSPAAADDLARNALVRGSTIPAPAGRADDAHWSGKGPLDP